MTSPDLLKAAGLPPDALDRARRLAREKGIPVHRAARALGLLSEDQVLFLASEESGIELVFPTEEAVDPELLSRFPPDLLRHHGALPLLADEEAVVVAFPEVPDPATVEALATGAGARIRPVLASPARLARLIDRAVGGGAVAAARVSAEESSGMAVFYRHLGAAFAEGADELRFEPAGGGIRVCYRTAGALREAAVESAALGAGIAARARTLAGLEAPDGPRLQTAVFTTRIRGEDVHLRLSILPVAAGDLIVVRREGGRGVPSALADFGLPEDDLAHLVRVVGRPAGGPAAGGRLVLVAAPEARLVASFVRALAETVDPANAVVALGYELPGVLVPATGEEPDAALRSLLATAPDVVFVDGGEDATGTKEAVAAALGGARVVLGLLDPIPEDAPLLVHAAGVHPARLDLVLGAVVAIRRAASGAIAAGAAFSSTPGRDD